MKRSAVAMILQVREGELHILMIKRAERRAIPGPGIWPSRWAHGPADAHGFAVAVRETEEEVGLRLTGEDQCIGRLSDIVTRPRKEPSGWR